MTNALVIVPGQTPLSTRKERLFQTLGKISKLFSLFTFSTDTDYIAPQEVTPEPTRRERSSGFNNFNFKDKKVYSAILSIVLIVVVVLGAKHFMSSSNNGAVQGVSDSKAGIKKPIARETLNKNFSFPLKDDTGKELSQLKVVLTDAEMQDQIVIKGQKAEALNGKIFLILNLKLTNNYSKTIRINTRDYFRLTINNSDEKLAGNVHNDPVEVQAISTLYTRLGFTVNKTDKNLVLHVGEINGTKQTVKLNLK